MKLLKKIKNWNSTFIWQPFIYELVFNWQWSADEHEADLSSLIRPISNTPNSKMLNNKSSVELSLLWFSRTWRVLMCIVSVPSFFENSNTTEIRVLSRPMINWQLFLKTSVSLNNVECHLQQENQKSSPHLKSPFLHHVIPSSPLISVTAACFHVLSNEPMSSQQSHNKWELKTESLTQANPRIPAGTKVIKKWQERGY